MTPLWLSLEVACIALFNIMVVGLLLCYILKRYSFPGKALIDSIVTLPLVLPPVVVGFMLLVIFTPGNSFGAWLDANGWQVVLPKRERFLLLRLSGSLCFIRRCVLLWGPLILLLKM